MKEVLIPIVKLVTARLTPVMMQRVVMSFHRPDTNMREKPLLALESGFHFLLENGGRIRLEGRAPGFFLCFLRRSIRHSCLRTVTDFFRRTVSKSILNIKINNIQYESESRLINQPAHARS